MGKERLTSASDASTSCRVSRLVSNHQLFNNIDIVGIGSTSDGATGVAG
jgi:hypothetical protein